MTGSFKINPDDMARLTRHMKNFVELLGFNNNHIMMQTSRVLAKNLMDYTPPPLQFLKLSQTAARQLTEKSVQRDINRAIKGIDPLKIKNPEARKAIGQLIDKNDYKALEEVLKKLKFQVKEVVPFAPDWHTKKAHHSDRIGVRKNQEVFTPNYERQEDYVKEKQSHVGSWKSVWAPFIEELNNTNVEGDNRKTPMRIPAYIRKHMSRYGLRHSTTNVQIGSGKNFVDLMAGGPNMGGVQRYFDLALQQTTRSLNNRFKVIAKESLRQAHEKKS